MDVITTHLNADFDALGSMLAARKLYPEAVLVFPGSQETSLRRFFLESAFYLAPFEKIGRVDLGKVRRLILVDVRQRDRLGKFERIVDSPDVEIHIYDHHPASRHDLRGDLEFCRPVGATVSLMVELLRCFPVSLTPEEATILLLGIYEDTGSLTFPSTTAQDLEAAAWLLRRGADLNAVASLITSELTQDQLSVLHELAQSRKTLNFHGVEVNLAEASADGYVGDLAALVHKLRDMENFNVLFVLARMENRVFLVARSRVREVDVGEIAGEFGGGGHPTAASATIKDLTMIQVRERLFALLSAHVQKKREGGKVRDYMSSPAISLKAEDTVQGVQEILRHYGFHSFPVVEADRLRGILNRQLIEKAAGHGLAATCLSELMSSDYTALDGGDPIEQAQDLLLGGRQRLIPVLEDGELVGVLARMDVIRSLAAHLPDPAGEGMSSGGGGPGIREKRLTRLMHERLPVRTFGLLKEMGEMAGGAGMNAYLVGGVVRDLLLRRENLDIDVVVEGDGILLAEKVCQQYGARKRSHSRFGTAKIIFPDGFRVDVATARLEYYAEPAALPNVERSSLKLDLYRRDFTMNTLAIRLNPGRFGELVDYFGGQRDIKDKVIRIIQNLSFIEDPTRIFRALRFQERFGFSLGPQTRTLMQNAIQQGLPSKLDGRRLLTEWRLILQETNPLPIIEKMQKLDLLSSFHPRLILDQRLRQLLERARDAISWHRLLYLGEPVEEWVVYFFCLLGLLPQQEMAEVVRRLPLRGKRIAASLAARGEAEQILRRMAQTRRALKPSEIYRLLHAVPMEVLLYIMARSEREKSRMAVSLYITRLRAVKVAVTGRDLRDLGYPEGPRYREILDKVLEARLNGQVKDLQGETAWITHHFPARR